MNAALLVPLLGVVFGPLLAYVLAARRLSGRIGTSEAADLWEESRAMRKDYREQIIGLERIIDHLRERLAQLEAENLDLRAQLRAFT